MARWLEAAPAIRMVQKYTYETFGTLIGILFDPILCCDGGDWLLWSMNEPPGPLFDAFGHDEWEQRMLAWTPKQYFRALKNEASSRRCLARDDGAIVE